MASHPVIEIHELKKVFLDFWRRPTVQALKGLDLSVDEGEVFGLLGPNGSGKSTTIKLLLGLLHPTEGSVALFGKSPDDIAVKGRIGYLPEVTNLHRFLTPDETLRYYAGLFGLDKRTTDTRTAELLKMVGLDKAAHRKIGQFSKGMARRVAIAQALINNPDLVILDEPTSGLDPIATRAVKDWIKLLARAGKTVFLTSHLLADVEDVCDRIAIICDGTLRAQGDISGLLQRPDALRFTVDGLPEEDSEPLRSRIAAETGRTVTTDHPKIDLETFFLNVVANADRAAGGGAVRSSDLAPFLSQSPSSAESNA